MDDYKSNSDKSRQEAEAQKVVSGEVRVKKNNVRKWADIFLPRDISDVKSYILFDIVVPGIKRTLDNTVHALLYGGGRPADSEPRRKAYDRYYESERRAESSRREPAQKDRRYCEDVAFRYRSDAENALYELKRLIAAQGVASMTDLYKAAGLRSPSYTYNDYGWIDLRDAYVVQTKDGDYIIKLPRAVPIDD